MVGWPSSRASTIPGRRAVAACATKAEWKARTTRMETPPTTALTGTAGHWEMAPKRGPSRVVHVLLGHSSPRARYRGRPLKTPMTPPLARVGEEVWDGTATACLTNPHSLPDHRRGIGKRPRRQGEVLQPAEAPRGRWTGGKTDDFHRPVCEWTSIASTRRLAVLAESRRPAGRTGRPRAVRQVPRRSRCRLDPDHKSPNEPQGAPGLGMPSSSRRLTAARTKEPPRAQASRPWLGPASLFGSHGRWACNR